MRHLLTTLTALCLASGLFAGTVTYTADDNTIFANPERGFITMLTGHLSTQHKYAVKGSESTLRNKQSGEKMSIVLVHYYLDNYVSTATIPSTVLNAFDEDMQVLRNLGMKAIIRFSYADGTYGSGKKSAHDAPLNIVKQHLAQYKSHWQANADVIFVFQAGQDQLLPACLCGHVCISPDNLCCKSPSPKFWPDIQAKEHHVGSGSVMQRGICKEFIAEYFFLR